MAAKPINATGYRKATYELALPEAPKLIVEVGVYQGALSRLLSTIPSVERYVIVDSWQGNYCGFGQDHMDRIAAECMAWAATVPKVEVLRMDSAAASLLFEDGCIDFWHTDGDHSLPGITGDIRHWRPKVRAGGIISGDNYEDEIVSEGINMMLTPQIGAKGRLWWARV